MPSRRPTAGTLTPSPPTPRTLADRGHRRHRLAHPPAQPRIDGSDHLDQRRAILPAGRHQRRRRAERSAAAAQHLRPAESGPRHRHRRPEPARSARPRHAAHAGPGQRPPPRRRRHSQQCRLGRHQHDPERPDRARRHRDRRQFGGLRFGRDRRRRQLRPERQLRRPPGSRARPAVCRRGFGGNQYRVGHVRQQFDDGRGNITLARRIFACRTACFGSDVPGCAATTISSWSTSIRRGCRQRQRRFPGPHFFRDIRSATIYFCGLVPISSSTIRRGTRAAASASPPERWRRMPALPYNCTYIFTADGQL